MEECFSCGVSEKKTLLSDAISEKGIVKICRKCSFKEEVLIIKKPSFDFEEPEKRGSVYERVSKIAGIDPEKTKEPEKNPELEKQEDSLKKIVEKNFSMSVGGQSSFTKKGEGLIDNFHWVIMRGRRAKHLTKKQLAEAIAEPELAVNLAEKGILPENSSKIIAKLENYLGIRIRKKGINGNQGMFDASKAGDDLLQKKEITEIDFDPLISRNLTIADLREMKKKKEEEMLGKDNGNFQKKESETTDSINKSHEKRELSQNEINDLIFGKKKTQAL